MTRYRQWKVDWNWFKVLHTSQICCYLSLFFFYKTIYAALIWFCWCMYVCSISNDSNAECMSTSSDRWWLSWSWKMSTNMHSLLPGYRAYNRVLSPCRWGNSIRWMCLWFHIVPNLLLLLRALAMKNANVISKAFLAFQGLKTCASRNGKAHYCKFFCNSTTVQF